LNVVLNANVAQNHLVDLTSTCRTKKKTGYVCTLWGIYYQGTWISKAKHDRWRDHWYLAQHMPPTSHFQAEGWLFFGSLMCGLDTVVVLNCWENQL